MDRQQQLLIQAMTYQHPEELPVSFGVLPAAWLKNGEELLSLAKEYPDLRYISSRRFLLLIQIQPIGS